MTFKDLQRLVQSSQSQSQQGGQSQRLFERLRNKVFWDWDVARHKEKGQSQSQKNQCCFNHIIGLPKKDGKPKAMFDYEKMLYKALMENSYLNSDITPIPRIDSIVERDKRRRQAAEATYADFKNRHVAVLKAAGLGITEFMLRWIIWLCLRNDDLKGSQIIVFTGPRLELAISLMNRMKDLFKPHSIVFNDKETVLNLNGVSIEAFPSHHADSARGLPSVSIIFADEAAFFPKGEQDNVMDIMLRNIPKSNPYLIAVSTPNKPEDLMERIMKEQFETSVWKKVFLDYTYGINKIYTQEEIDKIKNSRSFKREFCLQFVGTEGNVFSHQSIERCQNIDYNPHNVIPDCKISVGIDPSFGSSKFGIVVTRYANNRIEVVEAQEYERPFFSDMINKAWQIKQKHGITTIYCDAANPEIWQSLKKEFKEDSRSQYVHR